MVRAPIKRRRHLRSNDERAPVIAHMVWTCLEILLTKATLATRLATTHMMYLLDGLTKQEQLSKRPTGNEPSLGSDHFLKLHRAKPQCTLLINKPPNSSLEWGLLIKSLHQVSRKFMNLLGEAVIMLCCHMLEGGCPRLFFFSSLFMVCVTHHERECHVMRQKRQRQIYIYIERERILRDSFFYLQR